MFRRHTVNGTLSMLHRYIYYLYNSTDMVLVNIVACQAGGDLQLPTTQLLLKFGGLECSLFTYTRAFKDRLQNPFIIGEKVGL